MTDDKAGFTKIVFGDSGGPELHASIEFAQIVDELTIDVAGSRLPWVLYPI